MQLLGNRNVPTTSGTLTKEMSLSPAPVTTILDRLEARRRCGANAAEQTNAKFMWRLVRAVRKR
jgi:hypothetical protein